MVENKGKPGGRPQLVTAAQRALGRLLTIAFGGELPALAAIAHALAKAGRTALPESGPELVDFARTHIVPILQGELGPRLTFALMDDLMANVGSPAADRTPSTPSLAIPSSGVRSTQPSSGPRAGPALDVALLDAHTIRRPQLARTLLRSHFAVHLLEQPADLVALHGQVPLAAAIVDLAHARALEILHDLATSFAEAAVILRAQHPNVAAAAAQRSGLGAFTLCPTDAAPEAVVGTLKSLLAARTSP